MDILIVRHELVDSTLGRELDDTVGNRLDELGIVGGEEDIALESHEVVVQSLNRLQVEVVRRCVEDEAVGVLQLHPRNHTAHLLAAGEHVHFLLHILLAEEHAAEIRLHHHLVARTVL